MYFREFMEKERAKPLGPEEVLALCYRKNIKSMDYEDLKGKSLSKLLANNSAILILFTDHSQPSKPVGHFCLLFKFNNKIEFFDPVGLGLQNVTSITHSRKHLQKLLQGHEFHNNKTKYQRQENDTQTCGRHCSTRWNMAGFSPKKYQMFMHDKRLSPDDIVTLMTMDNDLTGLN
jgi:hypothetical protein